MYDPHLRPVVYGICTFDLALVKRTALSAIAFHCRSFSLRLLCSVVASSHVLVDVTWCAVYSCFSVLLLLVSAASKGRSVSYFCHDSLQPFA